VNQIVTMLSLAHHVTMFEACPHLTWVALLGAVPIAVVAGIWFGRRRKRAVLTVLATWCGVVVIYYFGVRTYILSKPSGYWCQKACIENLRQIDSGRELSAPVAPTDP